MAEFRLSCCAYCKMVLHTLKYPHCAVLGVLIGERKNRRIVDAVPLLHLGTKLGTCVEAGLAQVDAFCASHSPQLQIVGLYHANEELSDTGRDAFTRKIAEKIQSTFSDALLVTIFNMRLSVDSLEPCYLAYSFSSESKLWEPVSKQKCGLEDEEKCLGAASACIQTKMYRELVDFDNHLDNPILDYWNTLMNPKIDSII